MTAASEDVHRLNKREAFDAMRAYHQSEISHKKDCVDILKSILASTLGVYGGLIGTAMSEKIDLYFALQTSLLVFVFISISVFCAVWSTNKKIDQDNTRYRKYQDEYKLERLILHLEEDMWEHSYVSAWFEPSNPNITGYYHTKVILRVFGFLMETLKNEPIFLPSPSSSFFFGQPARFNRFLCSFWALWVTHGVLFPPVGRSNPSGGQ